jgi:hypothetical protein
MFGLKQCSAGCGTDHFLKPHYLFFQIITKEFISIVHTFAVFNSCMIYSCSTTTETAGYLAETKPAG